MPGEIGAKITGPGEVTLIVNDADKGEFKVEFTTEKLLSLTRALGELHKQLLGAAPHPPLEGQPVNISYGSQWYTELLEYGSMLSFWHRAFGPVGLLLHPQDVEHLANLLRQQVEVRQPPDAKPN